MAGYVPGQLPLNRSQEKEFVQAYEDVLERYKDPDFGNCAYNMQNRMSGNNRPHPK